MDSDDSLRARDRIAVIGGGYAGLAAAVRLAERGRCCDVFEGAAVLGGRARALRTGGAVEALGGNLVLDNGQHLLVGAYHALLGAMRTVGVDVEQNLLRLPLGWSAYAAKSSPIVRHRDECAPATPHAHDRLPKRTPIALLHGQVFHLALPRIPAPWHSLWGLLRAEGFGWRDKYRLITLLTRVRLAGWRISPDRPLAEFLRAEGQTTAAIAQLWEPLTLAALNTPLSKASTQTLLAVLRDTMGGARAASDFLLPRCDLSALFPEPAACWLHAHGSRVYTRTRITGMRESDQAWQLKFANAAQDARAASTTYRHVIVAVGPHQLATLAEIPPALAGPVQQLAGWCWQPIVTVYLRYPPGTRLETPFCAFRNAHTQWLFDQGQSHGNEGVFAAVLSAEGPHGSLSHSQLARAVVGEIAERFPHWPQPLATRVIAEKRATYSAHPALDKPGCATAHPCLHLAGDYTDPEYPATLEAAVRSGQRAAERVADSAYRMR